jgi:hypothetical protein
MQEPEGAGVEVRVEVDPIVSRHQGPRQPGEIVLRHHYIK